MPLWGTGRPGGNSVPSLNFVSLIPGDDFTLLDGTEAVASGSKSVAFARGSGHCQTDAGSTFQISGCALGSVITFQSSNGVPGGNQGAPVFTLDQLDATFNDVTDMTGNVGYTDVGRPSFYRCVVKTLAVGDAPVVIVKR